MQLQRGLRRSGIKADVKHVVELLDDVDRGQVGATELGEAAVVIAPGL
jgi:hypothetical protein